MSIEKPEEEREREEVLGVAETGLYPLVNERLQARYDRIAPQWNSAAYEGTRRDDLLPKLIALLAGGENPKVLEAMAGTALFAQQLQKEMPKADVYVLDFSVGMLNQVPVSLKRVQASVVAMPFPDNTFDRICIRNALYDLPRRLQQKALQEIARVLIPGGVFVLQHYCTTGETFEYLNELVKRKDIAGNQNEDMGAERFPRYFAPADEFESWLREAGFDFTREEEFEGQIRYMRNSEMIDTNLWIEYAKSLPEDIKTKLSLRTEEDGTLTFNFPGVIYKAVKK